MTKNSLTGFIYLFCALLSFSFSILSLVIYLQDTTKHYVLIVYCIITLVSIKAGLNTFEYYYDYFYNNSQKKPLLHTTEDV